MRIGGGWIGGVAIAWVAAGCAGKLAKAERWLEEAETGDPSAIAEAVARADAAVGAGRLAEDPAALAVRGRAYARRAATEAGPDQTAHLATATESFERALAASPKGAVHASLSAAVPEVEALLLSGMINDIEAKAWADADARLAVALRARAVGAALLGSNAELEAKLRRLAVQIAAQVGRPAEAAEHYAAYADAAGRDDTPLACLVARKLAEGDAPAAIAFVSPLSARYAEDEALLRTEVELRMGSGDTAGALARIERAHESLEQSVSGAFLAAGLYDAAGEPERARASWRRVLELDPRHVDAHIALGRSLAALAASKRVELRERSEELEERRPSREILELVREEQEAAAEAESLLGAARAIDPRSRPALEALVALYEARVSEIDEDSLSRTERAAFEADQGKLREAREALAALERG